MDQSLSIPIKNILIIESQCIYDMKEMEIKRITLKLV